MTPRAVVMVGHGINCDRELEHAFRKAGADVERVHLNDLLAGGDVGRFHIVAIPVAFLSGTTHSPGTYSQRRLSTAASGKRSGGTWTPAG